MTKEEIIAEIDSQEGNLAIVRNCMQQPDCVGKHYQDMLDEEMNILGNIECLKQMLLPKTRINIGTTKKNLQGILVRKKFEDITFSDIREIVSKEFDKAITQKKGFGIIGWCETPPPIGVMPREIWRDKVIQERKKDIETAIERYKAVEREYPKAWYEELDEYNHMGYQNGE